MTDQTENKHGDRHPSTRHIMQFFKHDHLPPHLQAISAPACALADAMVDNLGDSPELVAGLRKLLEAKDCFVRAMLVEPPSLPVQFWRSTDSDADPIGIHKCDSSNVYGFGALAVDRTSLDLVVAFHSGDTPVFYTYAGVPLKLYRDLERTAARGGSVGKFVAARIKGGPFDYIKMAEHEPINLEDVPVPEADA